MVKTFLHILVAACALGAAGVASAQWQWMDEDGRKVFSDRPPPPSIPESRILKAPRGAPASQALVPAQEGQEAAAAPDAGGEDPDLKARVDAQAKAEEEAQAREQADIERQNAEIEKRNAQVRQANCQNARQQLTRLEPGRRVMTTDAQGNTGYMDDATREAGRQRAQAAIRDNC